MARMRNLNRRDFTKAVLTFVGSIMGVTIGAPAIGYLISPAVSGETTDAWVPIGKLADYQPGVPTPFSFTRTKINGWEKTVNSFTVYVIRGNGEEVKILSSVCTHLSCRVTWKADGNHYACPCHDAFFGRDGEVLSGPPPRPLDSYETKLEDGNLFLHLSQS